MSSNFDWKTEEDFAWDEPGEAPPPEPSSGGRKRWLTIVVILLLVAGAGAFLVRQIEQRVDENTEAMRIDVLSSHSLLRLAEEEQDDELFFSLLSGRDSTWTAVQHKLFQAQSLRNRAPFGLQAQPGELWSPEQDDAVSITFSPDMLTAEVATLLPYEIQIGNELTEMVTLQETLLYRLGRERWLLSPPDESFWGDPLSAEGTRINLAYRQRDEEIATRLFADLERKSEELCGQLADIVCDPELQLYITLSTDPQTLIDAAQPRAGLLTNKGLRINLPSPTLVGLPQDEEGYQALYRGYAAQVATAVISQQVGYECCEQLPLYQALIDYQLNQLALKPWPVASADYERILDEQVSLKDYAMLWHSDNPADIYGSEGWRVYALVDYLLETLPDSNPAMLQRELIHRGSFRGWLNGLFPEENGLSDAALLSDLTRGFWVRGYTQALNTTDKWGPSPPDQDLYLTCVAPATEDEGGQIATLYRYDTAGDSWDNVYETGNFLWTASLPDDDMLLQQEYSGETRRWTAVIRQNEQVTPLLPVAEDYTVSFGQTDPDPSGLSAFVFPPEGEEATITWFDLLDCNETDGCANQELPGIPIWAPDGQRALFTDDPNSQIDLLRTELRTVLFNRRANNSTTPLYIGERDEFLGDDPMVSAEMLSPAGRGHAPFWINSDTYGYVTGEGDPIVQRSSRVMTASIDQKDPHLLFSMIDISQAMDGSIGNTVRLDWVMFWIHYVMVHPDNPDQLFVVVLSTHDRRAFVLTYDRASGEIQYLMSSGYIANHSLGLSPDGRYLVLSGMDETDPDAGEQSALLQVYDLQRDELIPFLSLAADFPAFATYDWSLDSHWLALLLDDGMAGFFSPDGKQLRLVETPPGTCGTPAWTN